MGTRNTERWTVTYVNGRVEHVDTITGLDASMALSHAGIAAHEVEKIEKATSEC